MYARKSAELCQWKTASVCCGWAINLPIFCRLGDLFIRVFCRSRAWMRIAEEMCLVCGHFNTCTSLLAVMALQTIPSQSWRVAGSWVCISAVMGFYSFVSELQLHIIILHNNLFDLIQARNVAMCFCCLWWVIPPLPANTHTFFWASTGFLEGGRVGGYQNLTYHIFNNVGKDFNCGFLHVFYIYCHLVREKDPLQPN